MIPRDPRAVLSRPAPPPDHELRYAEHADGIIDVYVPDALRARPQLAAPLVIFIHGGFWRQGVDRVPARPAAEGLRQAGYLVALPEYRRASPEQRGWPFAFDDVSAAIDAATAGIAELGHRVEEIVVVGHSAGGHLALLTAASRPDEIGVVALAPVADLKAAYRDGLGEGAAAVFMGTTPVAAPEQYLAADPAVQLRGLHRDRLIIVHGADDDLVPPANVLEFLESAPTAHFVELAATGHFELIDPETPQWESVLAAVGRLAGPR